MKIIDILNKKANKTLEDAFKFCYKNEVYKYDKKTDKILKGDSILGRQFEGMYILESHLNEEVWLFQEKAVERNEKLQKNEEIEEFTSIVESYHNKDTTCQYCNEQTRKINELVRAVNKLNKEREEK